MKALVTGCCGFIGSHLSERLLTLGHTVIGIDNLSTGRPENIALIKNNQNFHLIIDDLSCLSEQSGDGIDWVFHLAAKADIVPSIKWPARYFDANVSATMNLLEWSREFKVKRFVYTASSSCYGIPDDFPTTERAEIRPMYPYALTKYLGEELVLHWAKVYKLPAISLRLFNVYGPRARTSGNYGAAFGVFLSQLANNKPLTIVDDGEQKRDFTFVSDVCEALISAAESDISGQVFNIGSGGTYSVNQIAGLLGAIETVHMPKRPGEPGITFADISKARQLLGYMPKVTIEEGCWAMKQIVQTYKDAPLWTADKIKEETKDWFTYLGG